MTLGNAEVRLDEMVAAYSAFARGGEWVEPRYITGGEMARRTMVSPRTAFWITDILSDPEAREYTFGRGGNLEFPFPVAVKTGTSQAYHDNWTIGYSREVTVGVWVGNFDRTPLRDSTGVTGAGPIFHAVMLAAERRAAGNPGASATDRPILAPTPDTAAREICALSGMAANPWCPTRKREFVAGDRAVLPCSWHHLDDHGLLVIWPPEYRQWAQRAGLLSDSRQVGRGLQTAEDSRRVGRGLQTPPATPAANPTDHRSTSRPPLAIANPPAGATYLIDPTLRRQFQTLAFRATSDRAARIVWSVNGEEAGASSTDGAFMWPLVAGHHRITARDDQGRTAETTIVVR
jgi:penicillin-binding protein 1C